MFQKCEKLDLREDRIKLLRFRIKCLEKQLKVLGEKPKKTTNIF